MLCVWWERIEAAGARHVPAMRGASLLRAAAGGDGRGDERWWVLEMWWFGSLVGSGHAWTCLTQMSLQGLVRAGCKREEGVKETLCWMDAVLMRGRQE